MTNLVEMSDLVKRLRDTRTVTVTNGWYGQGLLEEAANKIERLLAERDLDRKVRDALIVERDALRARVEELEQDAARYKWLRDNRDQSELWIRHYEFGPLNGDAADQIIDAAMEWE